MVGTRIADVSTLTEYEFTKHLVNYSDTMYYENYYYFLDEADLKVLGIEKNNEADETAERKYIVNYATGEVFDITNKKYYTSEESVYLGGTNTKITENTYNFTDE